MGRQTGSSLHIDFTFRVSQLASTQCCRRVIQGAPCPSQSGTPLTSSKNVHYFDVLSSDRIMTTYTTTPTLALKDPAGKTEVFRWMAPN